MGRGSVGRQVLHFTYAQTKMLISLGSSRVHLSRLLHALEESLLPLTVQCASRLWFTEAIRGEEGFQPTKVPQGPPSG